MSETKKPMNGQLIREKMFNATTDSDKFTCAICNASLKLKKGNIIILIYFCIKKYPQKTTYSLGSGYSSLYRHARSQHLEEVKQLEAIQN